MRNSTPMRGNTRVKARIRRRRRIRKLLLILMLLTALLSLLVGVIKLQQNYQYREEMSECPPELLEALSNNPEMLEFVQGYPDSDGSVTGGLTEDELEEEVPLLLQWDTRWGYASYGGSNIALAGCAPTCLSMVVTGLTKDRTATPDALADYAMEAGYYIEGTGTAWSFMTEGAAAFGVEGRELPLDKNVVCSELEAGHPIICSMRPGDFTTEGHFIVLAGMRDGKIVVNDPNSRGRSSRLWDYETLESQIKNLWAFSSF